MRPRQRTEFHAGRPRRAAPTVRSEGFDFIRSAGFRRLEGRGSWVRGFELEATQDSARGLRGRHSEIDLRAMNRRAAVLEEPNSRGFAFRQAIVPARVLR